MQRRWRDRSDDDQDAESEWDESDLDDSDLDDSDGTGIDTIRCPECGTWIDEDAASCGQCGRANERPQGFHPSVGFVLIVVILIVLMGLSTMWF